MMLKVEAASKSLDRSRRFSVATLAEFWQCSSKHVLRLISSGKLRAINVGAGRKNFYVIPAESVERFESENKTGP